MGREKVRKVVFIVVNAEAKIESSWNRTAIIPPLAAMISSYSSIAIARYNLETMALLQESFARWTDQVRTGRCPPGQVSGEPGSCGDIEYYMVEVRFELLADPSERAGLSALPTSFHLPPGDVDRLRAAARRILAESGDFRRFLKDLGAGGRSR